MRYVYLLAFFMLILGYISFEYLSNIKIQSLNANMIFSLHIILDELTINPAA